MSLIKLPTNFKTLIHTSSKIASYKRAIEELVYNSLDADSTCIAIRIYIDENTIQVIDNGSGVAVTNFPLLGQKHATSKCVDLTSLKSAPDKYGFRGQALASLIEVSQTVKITSRHTNSEDTRTKTFYKGKEKDIVQSNQRPSKGTTVEIKGFLYNLNIQKKSVNVISEMQDIKQFLEQLSLFHTKVSFSLRDDTQNEIVFKIHKNRDIYQTLSTIYGIHKTDMRELKVEKNQYKVNAYIEKKDTHNNQRWIFLNGKIVQNSKLHSIVDHCLAKSLGLNLLDTRKSKLKNAYNAENDDMIPKGKIPFYLIFVHCPYYDYDVSYASKQTVLEFKNWDQINKLLEKLVKFYTGDVAVKNTKKANSKQKATDKGEIKEQVKKIMQKILGNSSKKPGVSQMQNGIKGKLIQRRRKIKSPKLTLLKELVPQENDRKRNDNHKSKDESFREDHLVPDQNGHSVLEQSDPKKTKPNTDFLTKKLIQNATKPVHNNKNIDINQTKTKERILKHKKQSKIKFDKPEKSNKERNRENRVKKTVLAKKEKLKKTNKQNIRQKPKVIDPLIKRFESETTSIKKRCHMLEKRVENFLSYKQKRKRNIFVNETIQYSNIIKDNKNYSVKKKIGEIIIHDYVPLPPKYTPISFDDRVWNRLQTREFKSSYDLVKTVLKTQRTIDEKISSERNTRNDHTIEKSIIPSISYSPEVCERDFDDHILQVQRLTFNSHNYENYQVDTDYHTNRQHFISTQSKDNFLIPRKKPNNTKNQIDLKCRKPNERKIMQYARDLEEQSASIDFTTRSNNSTDDNSLRLNFSNLGIDDNDKCYQRTQQTYTISEQTFDFNGLQHLKKNYVAEPSNYNPRSVEHEGNRSSQRKNFESNLTYTIDKRASVKLQEDPVRYDQSQDMDNVIHKENVLFIPESESQENCIDDPEQRCQEPLDYCEIVHGQGQDILEGPSNFRKNNDSLFNDDFDLSSYLLDRDVFESANQAKSLRADTNAENISHHFEDHGQQEQMDFTSEINDVKNIVVTEATVHPVPKADERVDFIFRNRLRFVPKGMSPIFENCQTKNACDYNFAEDYFERIIYTDFANNIQIHSEMLQPSVQNLKDLLTKEIQKVDSKLRKECEPLIFGGESLKNAAVLGQVDEKFIAAKIMGKSHKTSESSEFLVLFDQHAVHERISLEKNLTDYLDGDQWKSTKLDGLTLKFSKEDLIYLHNYKDKFSQFGLQWTILANGDVSINSIPEAVLGKHSRPVELIMKAAKNIISEEINAIKLQKGCVNLYPKTIMDLVFSEACRYAIKFGDKLSKSECRDLLNQLSECKTPFQCAHGRPVMAVIMELKKELRPYSVDISKLLKFAPPTHGQSKK